jgi:putative transposase
MNDSRIRRGYGALRIGRFSISDATYFLTICLQRPQTGLSNEALLAKILAEIHRLGESAHWTMRTGVVMPDHMHLLPVLGRQEDLSQTIRLFKGRLAIALRGFGLSWQPSFYDHRLRSTQEVLPTFRYIFLNPYHEGLIGAGEKWPGHFCAKQDWEWFKDLTSEEMPFPEWLL